MSSVSQAQDVRVIVGVDTHKDFHVAVAIDGVGHRLGELVVPANRLGYSSAVTWARAFGQVVDFGVEGTGSYGTGLCLHLQRVGLRVVEVNRPDRSDGRGRGKSDPLDAEAAARAVLAGTATSVPKIKTDTVEMIRLLKVARRGAMKARTQAATTLHATSVSVPCELRELLTGLSTAKLVDACSSFRVVKVDSPVAAAKFALRSIARRHKAFTTEINAIDKQLDPLVEAAAPSLIQVFGVGPGVAGTLLTAAGENPERLTSEASFASLCGASPVPASSGKTRRHRLSRGGNRQANCALHSVILTRMRHHEPTRIYVKRRTTEGLSKREIIRCLKRYLVREVYRALIADSECRSLSRAA